MASLAPSFGARTHCQRGHAYTAENTIIQDTGWRWCRECRREYMREYMRRYRRRAND
jgi:hypothetical protein